MICRSCGSSNADGAIYCARCGATLPSAAQPIVVQGQVGSIHERRRSMAPLALVGVMLGLLGVIFVLNDLLQSYMYAGGYNSASYTVWALGFIIVVFAAIYDIVVK